MGQTGRVSDLPQRRSLVRPQSLSAHCRRSAQVCIYSENEKESGSNLVTEVDMDGGPRDHVKALATEKGRHQGPFRVRFPSRLKKEEGLRASLRAHAAMLLLTHPVALVNVTH